MDIGFGQVDIHGRISDKDGYSWGDEFVLVEGTGIPATVDCGFGDPAMVVDRESGEVLVIYADDEGETWARPKGEFLSEVDREKYPDAKQKYRFELVEDGDGNG